MSGEDTIQIVSQGICPRQRAIHSSLKGLYETTDRLPCAVSMGLATHRMHDDSGGYGFTLRLILNPLQLTYVP